MNINSVIRIWLMLVMITVALAAQQVVNGTETKAAEWKCSTVAIKSDNPSLPDRLFVPYLQNREDFQSSRLVLSDDPLAADVVVRLSASEIGSTRILVSNR